MFLALFALASCEPKVTNKVFFDIEIDGEKAGRIMMGLYGEVVPKTVANFLHLCRCDKGVGESGKELCYKGTIFHRVIPSFMVQGGDIVTGDGYGSDSIYGGSFEDENFQVQHTSPGLLSMANSGADTNGSQFFITLVQTEWLDGKHVVFGRVMSGLRVVREIEAVGSQDGSTRKRVQIVNCGEL